MTQVTFLLAHQPTWTGVFHGMLVLAAVWWAWAVYAWLTSTTDVDEGGVRLTMLAGMAAMLVAALAVPGAFGDDACCSAWRTSPCARFISSSPRSSAAAIPSSSQHSYDSCRQRSSARR